MSFKDIQQLAKGTATININGVSEEVKLLTVNQREHYNKLVNEGLGTIQANFATNGSQKANMNIARVTEAQNKAEHYLIQCSFTDDDGMTVTEADIDALYNIYPVLVEELKRVNDIIETDDKNVIDALERETAENIKK